MPQLPSGRHVAIDPKPFAVLMENPTHFGNIHKVMTIDSIARLFDWCDLLFLIPDIDEHGEHDHVEFAESSLIPPEGHVVVNAGCRVSHWEDVAVNWSDEDRIAMRQYLTSERVADYLQTNLDIARYHQQRFQSDGDLLTKVLFGWFAAGVHPAQTQEWHGDDSPLWDLYDMLAALRSVVDDMVNNPDQYDSQASAVDRATGIWQMLISHYRDLHEFLPPDSDLRTVAQSWRDAGFLDRISPEKQKWLNDQMIIECVNLSDHAGEILELRCPEAFNIITLVTLSPLANK